MLPVVGRFTEHLQEEKIVPTVHLLLDFFVGYGLHDGSFP